MVQVFTTHDVLRATRKVLCMPMDYVYYFEYNNLRRKHDDLLEAFKDYEKLIELSQGNQLMDGEDKTISENWTGVSS